MTGAPQARSPHPTHAPAGQRAVRAFHRQRLNSEAERSDHSSVDGRRPDAKGGQRGTPTDLPRKPWSATRAAAIGTSSRWPCPPKANRHRARRDVPPAPRPESAASPPPPPTATPSPGRATPEHTRPETTRHRPACGSAARQSGGVLQRSVVAWFRKSAFRPPSVYGHPPSADHRPATRVRDCIAADRSGKREPGHENGDGSRGERPRAPAKWQSPPAACYDNVRSGKRRVPVPGSLVR